MKNKRLTYVLIPLVLIIWGLIFYKIFTREDAGDTPKLVSHVRPAGKKEIKDSFVINANYRDPFLSGYNRGERLQAPDNFKAEFTNPAPGNNSKPEVIVPDVKYFGLIANPNKNHKIGLFRLGNKDLILTEGELYEDFKIVHLFNDSVRIIYKSIKKTIRRNANQT